MTSRTAGPCRSPRRAGRAAARAVALAVATGVLAACGSSQAGSRPTTSVLTGEEIRGSTALTAFDVVQQLRPQYLRARGQRTLQRADAGEPVIYVDNLRAGGIDALRTIRAGEIEEIRYLTPSEATTRYGTGHLGGAIAVVLRRS